MFGEVVKEYVKEVVWDIVDVIKNVGGFFSFICNYILIYVLNWKEKSDFSILEVILSKVCVGIFLFL